MSSKTQWGDLDVDGDDESKDLLPPRHESAVDKDGIKTVTEYSVDENGDKVKIVKKVKVIKKQMRLNKNVLKRRKWKKFGDVAGQGAGPEPNITYHHYDDLELKLDGKKVEEKSESDVINKIKSGSVVVCRYCGETGHWSLKCPKRNEVAPTGTSLDDATLPVAAAGEGSTVGGKYVPPSRRAGAQPNRMPMQEEYTLRVTNLSEDVTEDDLRDLFRPFGHTSRIYLAKDRITNQSRGFAFINYTMRQSADDAIAKLNGYGYDNLILHVEWAKPREQK